MPESQRAETTLSSSSAARRDGKAGTMKAGLVAFLDNPAAYDYAEVSVNLCQVYTKEDLNAKERQIADDILRDLSRSMEVKVREALSAHLKESGVLPHDIALSLAHDVETVALPMIQFSEVLTESDLVEIVRSRDESYQSAVASRQQVSHRVSDAIIETGNEKPVHTLVANPGASITEAAYDNVIQLFPESDPIKEAMAERPDLPLSLAEKLVEVVSENLRFELISRHGTSAELVERLMQQGSEGATIALLSRYEDIGDAEVLSGQLFRYNRLKPTLLLRAIYCGQLDFFEFGVARLAQMGIKEARAHIHSAKPYTFQRLYKRAQLPPQLFLAFTEALSHLAEEIAGLEDPKNAGSARRVVSPLIRRRGFDKKQFESALLMASSR